MDWKRFGLSALMFITLSSSSFYSPCSSSPVDQENFCDVRGCCSENNYGPGPLDLTSPSGGFDAGYEGDKMYVYHCVRYFRHFHWFRLQNDSLVPFPWGREGKVSFVQDRRDNQTLVFDPVSVEDEGYYVFVASNGTHNVTGNFALQVDCRDTGASFTTSEQPVQVAALDSNKTLHCAVTVPNCKGRFYETNVFWTWNSFTSGSPRMLRNTTLDSVSVVCEGGRNFGLKCDVLIRRVHQELFNGEFVCKMSDGDLTQPVRLVPPPNLT